MKKALKRIKVSSRRDVATRGKRKTIPSDSVSAKKIRENSKVILPPEKSKQKDGKVKRSGSPTSRIFRRNQTKLQGEKIGWINVLSSLFIVIE